MKLPLKRRASKKARARAKEQRDLRLKDVVKLRFVQCWTNAEIAKHLNLAERTVERDVRILRQRMRQSVEKNLEYEIRDIAENLKLSHAEKIKYLWNEYFRLEGLQAGVGDMEKKSKLQEETRPARMKILRQITDTEDSFVEQMRRMGIAKETLTLDVPGRALIYLPDNRRGEADAGNG